MRYFKRLWNETRGDQFDHWGTATYYFEVGSDGYPIHQIQIYENGNVLSYDRNHLDDLYGGLGDQALNLDEFEQFEIDESEFNKILKTAIPINRNTQQSSGADGV